MQQILKLVAALRLGSTDRIQKLTDLELGLMTVLELTPEEKKRC